MLLCARLACRHKRHNKHRLGVQVGVEGLQCAHSNLLLRLLLSRWGVLRACFRGGRGVGIEKRDQTVGGYFVWEGDGGSFQGEQSERGEVGDAVLRAQRFVARLGLCQLEPVLVLERKRLVQRGGDILVCEENGLGQGPGRADELRRAPVGGGDSCHERRDLIGGKLREPLSCEGSLVIQGNLGNLLGVRVELLLMREHFEQGVAPDLECLGHLRHSLHIYRRELYNTFQILGRFDILRSK
mmetsp:Transcript_25693/g.48727  ORF Transcript_25693/g.48727 Transcript_25693/m.48727 type:complete len:241 (-) Transcript_25693:268-990(-)